LLIPGGILLLSAAVLANTNWLTLPLPALSFLYYSTLIGGILLAWRFHSSRVFFALLVLFLAREASGTFLRELSPGLLGWTGLRALAILVPLNLFLIAQMPERGFTVSGTASLGLFLLVQIMVLTVISQSSGGSLSPRVHHLPATVPLPDYALIAFILSGTILFVRSLLTRKPADNALLWSLAAFFLALHYSGMPRTSTLYSMAGALILATAVIENSYLLAYHDELTSLPSRRSFNDALLRLPDTYSVAVVDIDHFKRFNDTYGHDVGDQVLRLVATNLSRVTGGGEAYRCGGEEFTILFPGKTMPEVLDHLEQLRENIESSEFRMRGGDRRHLPRGPDRRSAGSKSSTPKKARRPNPRDSVAVTVSMGVASGTKSEARPEVILQRADKALYRAKANGRNRIETAAAGRQPSRAKAAEIA
jgi:diguanylate cyclase (GGDEF)-like protein